MDLFNLRDNPQNRYCFTDGKLRHQANEALVQTHTVLLEDHISQGLAVTEGPRHRSARDGHPGAEPPSSVCSVLAALTAPAER